MRRPQFPNNAHRWERLRQSDSNHSNGVRNSQSLSPKPLSAAIPSLLTIDGWQRFQPLETGRGTHRVQPSVVGDGLPPGSEQPQTDGNPRPHRARCVRFDARMFDAPRSRLSLSWSMSLHRTFREPETLGFGRDTG